MGLSVSSPPPSLVTLKDVDTTTLLNGDGLKYDSESGLWLPESYETKDRRGAASGYASLGSDSLVPQDQLGIGSQDGKNFLRDDGLWQRAPSKFLPWVAGKYYTWINWLSPNADPSNTATSVSNGGCRACPIMSPYKVDIDRIAVYCSSAPVGSAGPPYTLKLGIYNCDQTTGVMTTPFLDWQSVTIPTDAIAAATISKTLEANVIYWLLIGVPNNTTTQVYTNISYDRPWPIATTLLPATSDNIGATVSSVGNAANLPNNPTVTRNTIMPLVGLRAA